MNRRVASAAGAMLLIGVGTLTSPAFSQGPMAPRMDVAPPPVRVAPPPPPPVFVPPVVPTPPPMPVAPVMAPPPPPAPAPKTPTASAPATPTPVTPAPVATPTPAPPPATASPQTPRATASAPPPYTDSQVKALRGVGVGLRGPGGTRQVTSDSNGVVSLGKLGPGRHELTVNPKSLGPGTQPGAQPVALVGLLLPAVQKVRDGEPRYRTFVLKPVNDQTPLTIRLQYNEGDGVSTVDLGNGNAIFASYSVGDLNARLSVADVKLFDDLAKRNTSGETRLVFVTPVPGSTAAALADANNILQEVSTTRLGTSQGNPGGPGKPNPNYSNNPIPGIDVVRGKQPGGTVITQSTGNDGTTTLGVLTPGTHSVSLDTKKLLDVRVPGASGSEPAQPAGILIGLLLPAVQKVREAPQPTTVEHAFPRSFLANARELRIDIVIPEGGGSPKVDWGDGSPTTDVGRDGVPAPSGLRIAADVSTIRVQNLSIPQTGTSPTGTTTAQEASINSSGTVIAQEAIINTTRDNIKKPPPKLPNVGGTATGPGGVMQVRSDGEGWTRFGNLPIGNTVIEFNGADLASALKTVEGPTTPTRQQTEGSTGIIIGVVAAAASKTAGESTEPTRQQTNIELLVVISLVAIKTDGTPVVFTRSVPAKDVKTLKADLRIGRDGNAMAVDWGNGPQLPQVLPRTGAATLTVPGPNGPIPLDPAVVKSLQDRVAGSAPGLVESNTLLQEVSTTRLGTSPGNAPTGTPTAQEATINTSPSNIKHGIAFTDGLAKIPGIRVTATGPGGAMRLQSDGQGVTSFGKLPIGTTRVEFNSENVATAFRSIEGSTPSTPGVPAGMRCRGCFLVPIIMLKADGAPVVSIWNGDALPNKLQALVRIGRDGNLMDVDWGSGPQPVQALTRVGAGTLSMTGSGGPVPVSPAVLKMLQDHASKMTPGMVDANNILMDVSTTR